MGYTGEYHDAETGFIYLRARYYNPAIGRFINEDPIRDGLNWYVYCNNNPIAFTDPNGTSPTATAGGLWCILSGIDGPLPIGEIVGGIIFVCTIVVEVVNQPSSDTSTDDTDESYEEAKSKGEPAPNHSSTDNEQTDFPLEGEKNSSKDLLDKDGNLKRRRYYGPDGKAEKDIDYKHSGDGHKFPHEHKWDWSSGTPNRIP